MTASSLLLAYWAVPKLPPVRERFIRFINYSPMMAERDTNPRLRKFYAHIFVLKLKTQIIRGTIKIVHQMKFRRLLICYSRI